MNWLSLQQFTLTEDWQLSAITNSVFFKLVHTISNYSAKDSIALIALMNDENTPIEIFEPRRILPRQEAEIIKFSRTYNWDYKLAIKQVKLPNTNLINWQINVSAAPLYEPPVIVVFPSGNTNLQAKFNDAKKTMLLAVI